MQVISFIDVFLRITPAKSVLCIVPINTIQNWANEFKNWLPDEPFTVHLVSVERVKKSGNNYNVQLESGLVCLFWRVVNDRNRCSKHLLTENPRIVRDTLLTQVTILLYFFSLMLLRGIYKLRLIQKVAQIHMG